MASGPGGGGGKGYSWEFLVGVCRPDLQMLTLFQTQKMSFFTPVFRPGRLKSIPVFRSRLETHEIDLDWNANKKMS